MDQAQDRDKEPRKPRGNPLRWTGTDIRKKLAELRLGVDYVTIERAEAMIDEYGTPRLRAMVRARPE